MVSVIKLGSYTYEVVGVRKSVPITISTQDHIFLSFIFYYWFSSTFIFHRKRVKKSKLKLPIISLNVRKRELSLYNYQVVKKVDQLQMPKLVKVKNIIKGRFFFPLFSWKFVAFSIFFFKLVSITWIYCYWK